MLSRRQVLSAPPATVESGATCPICLEGLEGRHPVRLRCNANHVYCKECIRPWAIRHRRCIMMCEIRPWDPAPWADIAPALIDQTRADMLVATLYTFGVLPGTKADFITGPFTFGEDDAVVPRDGHWPRYLGARREPDMRGMPVIEVSTDSLVPMAGTGLSEPTRMVIPIVNLANAIPFLAANSGRPYSSYDMLNWRLVVDTLVSHIPTHTLIFMNIQLVPARWKADIRIQLASLGSKVEDIPFFQPGPLGSDLDLLIEYVAYTMFRECWVTVQHTRAGFDELRAFRVWRRSQARGFQEATWMLEDSGRQCTTM